MKKDKPNIDIDIESLFEENRGTIEDALTKELKERIRKKIQYDLGLGGVIDDWMEENVVPHVVKYFDDNRDVIVEKYLSAYEEALNKALEKRAGDMLDRATSVTFQEALRKL